MLSRSDWVTKGLVDRMSSAGFGQFGAALGSGRRPTRLVHPVVIYVTRLGVIQRDQKRTKVELTWLNVTRCDSTRLV